MLKSHELTIKRLDVTEKLNGIEIRSDDPDADTKMTERRQLMAELSTLNGQFKAAIIEESDATERASFRDDSESRELTELRSKVNVGTYVAAALAGIGVSGGPEGEFNQHLNMRADQFPMRLLLGDGMEKRTAVDGDPVAVPQPWLTRVFGQSAAERVGVSFRSVPPGVASLPIITGGPTGAQRARAQDAVDTAVVASVSELKPKANRVFSTIQFEDTYRMPGFEAAVVADFRGAVVDAVDKAIFISDTTATGTDADITGLTTTAGISEQVVTQTNKVLNSGVLAAFAAMVDGRYATSMEGLRVVMSKAASVLWASTIPNAAQGNNASIAQVLRDNGISWQVREGIQDSTTNNGDFGAVVGLAQGIEGAAVAAVWDDARLIRDPYSGQAGGNVGLSLDYVWDFAVARTGNFQRIKFVT